MCVFYCKWRRPSEFCIMQVAFYSKLADKRRNIVSRHAFWLETTKLCLQWHCYYLHRKIAIVFCISISLMFVWNAGPWKYSFNSSENLQLSWFKVRLRRYRYIFCSQYFMLCIQVFRFRTTKLNKHVRSIMVIERRKNMIQIETHFQL